MATLIPFTSSIRCLPPTPAFAATSKPLAVLSSERKMRVPYELRKGQSRLFHELPSGLSMEVIVQEGAKPGERTGDPPLVFVHGSYHAAWCWAEHWLPFFSSRGFDCYALSLLGQGESDVPPGSVAGSLQTHAADVADFISRNLALPPVLLGHSFGGLIVQYYLANIKSGQYSGQCSSSWAFMLFDVVLTEESVEKCKAHSRNLLELSLFALYLPLWPSLISCFLYLSGLVWRYLFTKPIAAFKVTRSLAAKAFQTSVPLCKETFFSPMMEDQLVQRYQLLMKESSHMPLFDLRKLNASLPVPSIPKSTVQILVMGANNDFIVDAKGLEETGNFYRVSPICVEGVAHDLMLDCSWEKGAEAILSWLRMELV
ncbi:hypothetical protein CDL15_Pgr025791 [Punica granatum]|uniref:AB hydrolase-1 domain-containing protein n=1 Tax=Punica granatum TaxID=22663 RepID=A0A218WCZ2_PUNGR|nr:hypothetical protein CDL15_Pgr025791 [Punica granatum]